MEEQDIVAMMGQLGGMTALANADLPARIFGLWANALKTLSETESMLSRYGKDALVEREIHRRTMDLMAFCVGRMEMVAASQPQSSNLHPKR